MRICEINRYMHTGSYETEHGQEGFIGGEPEVVEVRNGRGWGHRCIREETAEGRVDKRVRDKRMSVDMKDQREGGDMKSWRGRIGRIKS